MSTTREEAIEILRKRQRCCKVIAEYANETVKADELREIEAINFALTALRGPTREMVVLCKDCQYWQGNNGGYPHPECRWGYDETPDEDDYCSFAEKLEVNKNG